MAPARRHWARVIATTDAAARLLDRLGIGGVDTIAPIERVAGERVGLIGEARHALGDRLGTDGGDHGAWRQDHWQLAGARTEPDQGPGRTRQRW